MNLRERFKTFRTGRRNFIKALPLTAAAAPYFVPSTVFGKKAPGNRINLGCIGTGFQWQWDTSAFLSLEDVQIVAVCDVDKKRRENAKKVIEEEYAKRKSSGTFSGVKLYNDFRDLISFEDIDAVAVATPDHWHSLISIAASNAGKAIYCQKPLSYNIEEGRALSDTVRRNKTVFQTGSQQRSIGNFRFACELVRNKKIGGLKSVEVGLGGPGGDNVPCIPMQVPEGFDYSMWLGPAPWAAYTEKRCHYNFRFISDYAYGLVTDWGAHHIDTAQWGMGTDQTGPVEIEGKAEFYRNGLYDTPKKFQFTCTYPNGVSLTVADSSKLKLGIKFIGTEGWVFITRGEGEGDISAEPESILSAVISPDEIRLYRHRTTRPPVKWSHENLNNTINHYINFIDCIHSGKETAAPVETGHRSVSICHLAHISMELDRKLRWNPEKERFINDPEANGMLTRSMRSPWHL
jgi:predicted dehydrogenase